MIKNILTLTSFKIMRMNSNLGMKEKNINCHKIESKIRALSDHNVITLEIINKIHVKALPLLNYTTTQDHIHTHTHK